MHCQLFHIIGAVCHFNVAMSHAHSKEPMVSLPSYLETEKTARDAAATVIEELG